MRAVEAVLAGDQAGVVEDVDQIEAGGQGVGDHPGGGELLEDRRRRGPRRDDDGGLLAGEALVGAVRAATRPGRPRRRRRRRRGRRRRAGRGCAAGGGPSSGPRGGRASGAAARWRSSASWSTICAATASTAPRPRGARRPRPAASRSAASTLVSASSTSSQGSPVARPSRSAKRRARASGLAAPAVEPPRLTHHQPPHLLPAGDGGDLGRPRRGRSAARGWSAAPPAAPPGPRPPARSAVHRSRSRATALSSILARTSPIWPDCHAATRAWGRVGGPREGGTPLGGIPRRARQASQLRAAREPCPPAPFPPAAPQPSVLSTWYRPSPIRVYRFAGRLILQGGCWRTDRVGRCHGSPAGPRLPKPASGLTRAVAKEAHPGCDLTVESTLPRPPRLRGTNRLLRSDRDGAKSRRRRVGEPREGKGAGGRAPAPRAAASLTSTVRETRRAGSHPSRGSPTRPKHASPPGLRDHQSSHQPPLPPPLFLRLPLSAAPPVLASTGRAQAAPARVFSSPDHRE